MRTGLKAPVRHRRLLLLALVAVLPALAACQKPMDATSTRDVAWVTTGASVTLPGTGVTPVDLARRHVQAKVTVGSLPSALAYAPGGRALLVVTQGDDRLHEIDTATLQVLHVVGVGVEPDAVAVAPGGSDGKGVALVANLDSNSVTPVDLGTWRAGTPIVVGSAPVAIAVSVAASGAATAFVADSGSNAVTPIDVATLQAGPAIPVGPAPQTVAAAPGEVLVGNFGAGLVPVSVVGLTLGPPVALPDVAQGIALSADGSTAWVTQQAGTLIAVTLATGKVGLPLHLGGHPSAIVIGAG